MQLNISSLDKHRIPNYSQVEFVERKGLGHPDSICDSLAEIFGRALCQYYYDQTGQILHHNVDKALLVGGQSKPKFGGGNVPCKSNWSTNCGAGASRRESIG